MFNTPILVLCTLCNEGKFDLGAGHSIPVNNKFPHTLGHEIEGTVVACGSNVPKDLFTRDKSYAVFPWLGCEKDTCVHCHTKDTYNLCEVRGEASKKFVDGRSLYGGYASHSVVPHWRYLIDYEGALWCNTIRCSCLIHITICFY